MLSDTEERNLSYIAKKARQNIKGQNFFTMTRVLEVAFLMTEDRAYEVLKNILARKTIRNTPEAIVDEYIDMLKKGYGSIQEQVDVFGGDKLATVMYTARIRFKDFGGGSFLDLLREVYNVKEEELLPLTGRYLDSLESQVFSYTIDQKSFEEFIESDVDELDAQFDRFMEND